LKPEIKAYLGMFLKNEDFARIEKYEALGIENWGKYESEGI